MNNRAFTILFSLLLLFAVCNSEAQKFTPLPPELDGSMMPFDFSSCTQTPVLPDSLSPIYISYVARHGSRYLSGPKKIKPVLDALNDAKNKGTLSDTGEAFLSLMESVVKANEGNWGDLSPIGIAEQRTLGTRIFNMLPALGETNTFTSSISSYVPRVAMTMYQFSNQLSRLNEDINTATDEGPAYSPMLCCFIADNKFADYRKKGDWKQIFNTFVEKHISIEPARHLFTKTDLSDKELRQLTFDMYEVLKANRAAGLPAPTTQWMSITEYRNCWRASNLQHYLRNCITPQSDLAAKATDRLLLDIIRATDDATDMKSPSPKLNGWFGHAETLLPLLSLMQMPGCYDMTGKYESLDNRWKIQKITPLGANLVILISRGPSGERYASVQLNGQTVNPIPGRPAIIRWKELRQFWLNKLIN